MEDIADKELEECFDKGSGAGSMRAAELSPGTGTRLRLAQKQVKLRQVDVYAKERNIFGRYLNEKVSGSLTFDGERKRTRHVPRQTEGPISGSTVDGPPKRDDERETGEG